jgi:CubicO group peptidase (beta-lactamase class C family)
MEKMKRLSTWTLVSLPVFLFLAVFIFHLSCRLPESSPIPVDQPSSLRLNKLLEEFSKEAQLPGLSVAVFKDDRIIYQAAFGFSDLENKIPASAATRYRIGSLTKLFTAVTTLKLYEKGIIQINTPVSKYLPGLPESYRNVTLTKLAGHLAGIRHYRPDEFLNPSQEEYQNLEPALARFISDPPVAPPGARYLYSSYGYVLIGAALEKACQKKFNEILKESLIEPLGLEDTAPEKPGETAANTARFYRVDNSGNFIEDSSENPSYKWPASGYLSTVLDLGKFAGAVISKDYLQKSSLSLILAPQKTSDGKETACGFGFRIGKDSISRKVLHHGGESPGSRAFLLIYPAQKISIILLANLWRAPIFEGEAETVAGFFLNDYSFESSIIPAGRYEFTAEDPDNERPLNGLVVMEEEGGLIYNFLEKPVPVSLICLDHGRIRLTASTRRGFINIWLVPEGRHRYEGYWGYDKPAYSFRLSKSK